jgi:hypothetical protein
MRVSAPRFAPAVLLLLVVPAVARGDRDALTVELGVAVAGTRLDPTIGSGDPVNGTLGGAELRVRHGLSHRLEVQAGGFWNRTATFVNTGVATTSGAGPVTGDLRRDVGRFGAMVGARYVTWGTIWRVPVGFEAGWLRSSVTKQDLVDRSDPRGPVSYGIRIADQRTNDLFVAPFAGIEWLATDRLSLSVVPRLEFAFGARTAPAVVVPFAVGWSWFLL